MSFIQPTALSTMHAGKPSWSKALNQISVVSTYLQFLIWCLFYTCLWLTCSATTPTTRSCRTWAWNWDPRCRSGRGRRSQQGEPPSNKSCKSKELFSFTFLKGIFPQLLATFDEKGTSPSTGSSSEKTEFFKIQNCKTYSSFLLFQLPLCTVQWSFWAGHPHVRIVWKKKHRNTTCEDSLKNHKKYHVCMPVYKWSRFFLYCMYGSIRGSTRGPRGPKSTPTCRQQK